MNATKMELNYPPRPRVRFGWNKPVHPELARIIGRHHSRYRRTLEKFLGLVPSLRSVQVDWKNGWFEGLDAVSLYGFIATRKPRRYIEIGSGTSTRFARAAIDDHSPRTELVSIDPEPRSGIDAICDKVVRAPLEEMPGSFFAGMRADDVLLFDGSHRAFQNSDVTVFFTEILHRLPRGMLVGIHDILLPHDYPEQWCDRLYNEQYLLACWLLAGRLRIELPVFHCSQTPALHGILDELWCSPPLLGAPNSDGSAFWFATRPARRY